MLDAAIDTQHFQEHAETLRKEGQTVMFTAIDGRFAGLVGVADPIKESTPEAIKSLHKEGLKIIMLTGDNRTTAESVAKRLTLDDVVAEVLPDQKAQVVKDLQAVVVIRIMRCGNHDAGHGIR